MDYSIAESFFKINSKFQEKYVEYTFLQQVLLQAACRGLQIDIARADVDAFGYDIMLTLGAQTLFIQLKSVAGRAAIWDVHKSMLEVPNRRIILSQIDKRDPRNSLPIRFLCFDRALCNTALQRSPKVPHASKCMTQKSDYRIDITNNILSIFDERNVLQS